MPHTNSITISADSMGCDCRIAQNTTIGASFTQTEYNESTAGNRPRLGHLTALMPGAVVSGRVTVGHCVICAANSVITKDVPSFSIVYGVNQIRPLSGRHTAGLQHILYQCAARMTSGKYAIGDRSYTDNAYLDLRRRVMENIADGEAVLRMLREGIEHTEYAEKLNSMEKRG